MAEYIERDALLSDLEAAEKHKGMGMIIAQTLKQYVKRVPAADVEPVRHGWWIYGEDIDIQCAACGGDALTEGDYRQVKSRYCPCCGAKMDLEESK